ncbi:MAG TPA: bifunctional isocitrate dehydrogenase kinase/phosphatase [Steroidobacteraceae bacterium]|jgi:isocitrate dehydrogenase kinase/phosphatase|nr:bifunctional isocitrate dehydrogenase kinase/phosphatase [Steroidobacteraceae bacterium]
MSPSPGSVDTPAPRECARQIVEAFARYNAEFRAITRRAPLRFDARDWRGSQRDAVERIELYDRFVNQTIAELRLALGAAAQERALWRRIRAEFAARITDLPDPEFTKTFFSSISRRLFGTVGVAPDIEFVANDLDPLADIHSAVGTNTYVNHGSLPLLFEDLLGDVRFRSPWRDLDKSIAHVAGEVRAHLHARGERREIQRVEVIRPVFYQISRAYVVGRLVGRGFVVPVVIALKNGDGGVLVDAVMLAEDDVSIVFSFTRSYFHADLERVAEAVVFLKSIMPRKPVSELFTVLGRARQGKTERYRELMRNLEHTRDLFVHAPGEHGLVMVCFTLPSSEVVFKVIRDRFPYPKTVLREEVMAKYRMVFIHDRAGRLVDAQEFRRLRFPRERFAPELLQELRREAAGTVHEDGEDLVFDHMYIERRMTPLNLYLRSAPAADAERVVLDYGQCIRDLAYTNIFPGDLLLKNFGVTRHGRVIFYDYDELCRVTDCNFRDVPPPTHPEDEMRAEAWFYVGESDVFPETFINFLGFSDEQRAALLRMHGEILTAAFWRGVQQRLSESEVLEVLPYHPHRVRVAGSL